jgi:CHAT domain-containing protein
VILWMMALRQPAAIHAGSRRASDTRTAKETATSIRQARLKGDWEAVEGLCEAALNGPDARADPGLRIQYLSCVGGARMLRLDYRGAMQAYLEAKQASQSLGDREKLGAALFNLSSLYQQVWDNGSALRAAEEGLAATQGLQGVYYRPQLLLQLGRLQPEDRADFAADYFRKGIDAAQKANSPEHDAENKGYDLLGVNRRMAGDFSSAENAHWSAYRSRSAREPGQLGLSLAYLSDLRLAEARAEEPGTRRNALINDALEFNTQALSRRGKPNNVSFPGYVLHHQRGQILLLQSRRSESLAEFGIAVADAQQTRRHFLPALQSLDATSSGLEVSVFEAFVDAAAGEALETGNPSRARELAQASFLADEENRSASLRQSLDLEEVWRERLPRRYWSTLTELRREQASILALEVAPSARSQRLELELTEMEARAGLDYSQKNFEIIEQKKSLKHILEGLRDSEVLLSFHLGERRSFLWAVTRTGLRVYPVPARDAIRRSVKKFRDAVEAGKPDAERLGRQLYRELFGGLGEEGNKPEWLLSLEDALFELPFAALVPGTRQSGRRQESVYLIEQHSIQIVPGAFLLKGEASRTAVSGRLLAVGDPIYNTADPRLRGVDPSGSFRSTHPPFHLGPFHLGPQPEAHFEALGQLNRLAGTARETELVARGWGGPTELLTGTAARREPFLKALTPVPDVIHLATHALVGHFPEKKSFVALGLGEDGRPELFSEADIGKFNVPGTLVVMTGCSTASGEILEGAGLEGLTQAWAVAGARGVIATQWPVPDLSGELFRRFYASLKTSSTADALRSAQTAMIHAGAADRSPSVWASYTLFGGTR